MNYGQFGQTFLSGVRCGFMSPQLKSYGHFPTKNGCVPQPIFFIIYPSCMLPLIFQTSTNQSFQSMKQNSSPILQNCSFRMGFNPFCHASQAAKGPGAVEAWIQNNTSQWGKIRLMNDNVICNETRLTPTDIGYKQCTYSSYCGRSSYQDQVLRPIHLT